MANPVDELRRMFWLPFFGVIVALVAIALVVLASVLVGQQEWSCQYRYWSDGEHNGRSVVPVVMAVIGVASGLFVSGACVVAYLRSRPNPWSLWLAALGLAPLAVVIAVLVVSGGNPGYDCSTG